LRAAGFALLRDDDVREVAFFTFEDRKSATSGAFSFTKSPTLLACFWTRGSFQTF
jgi:hypothetical protein